MCSLRRRFIKITYASVSTSIKVQLFPKLIFCILISRIIICTCVCVWMIHTNEGKIKSYLNSKYCIPNSPIPYKQWFPYMRDWMMGRSGTVSNHARLLPSWGYIESRATLYCKMEIKFTLKINDDFLKGWLIIIYGLN